MQTSPVIAQGKANSGSRRWRVHPMPVRSAKIKLSLDPNILLEESRLSSTVVPGDHPDPTIIRVGRTYWASCTSSEWSPQFPLFRSTDLVHWKPAGAIFPVQPDWADGAFWAPELIHDEGSDRYFVWYVARKRGGPLCVAVATAEAPAGPYTDHGPLICQEVGSIDPCFARDEHGAPFLIWKEDGNSQGLPTPIWAQRLGDDLLHLVGEKTQLLVADQPWEEGLVEGPYILLHEGRFYMFYAGNTCCGRECKYAEGVARADHLLGPWEKFPGNPLIGANDKWRCPGHGTAVRTAGVKGKPEQSYLFYHAYPADGDVYVGREAMLDEIAWTAPEPDGKPGWPIVNSGKGPGVPAHGPAFDFTDDFKSRTLGSSWQWPVNTRPDVSTGHGMLTLRIPLQSHLAAHPVESALLAVPRPSGEHFSAAASIMVPAEPDPALWAGLTVIGDPFNTVGLGLRGKWDRSGHHLILWQRRGADQAVVWEVDAPDAPAAGRLYLRCVDTGHEHHLQFSFSLDGESWQNAGEPYDAEGLPAWDRGLRLGFMLEGPRGSSASFGALRLRVR